jgi:hypothetical protein
MPPNAQTGLTGARADAEGGDSSMPESHWSEWTRTLVQPREREELWAGLTSEQRADLLERDYVFVPGTGVLWRPPDGAPWRRARFTHGTHFRTQRGEFYIDSEGSVHELRRGDRVGERQHPFSREDARAVLA